MEDKNNNEEHINSLAYCMEVRTVIEELLRQMNVAYEEVEVFKGLSEVGPKFIIKSRESGILIGARGENLRAFSHLARRIVFKKKDGLAKFTLDINNYQEEATKKIKNQALSLAEEVRKNKRRIELEPMSSYERMIIHSLFSTDPEIETESIGEKSDRRVVIKPRK